MQYVCIHTRDTIQGHARTYNSCMIFPYQMLSGKLKKIVIDYASINVVHNTYLLQVEGLGYRFPSIHVPITFIVVIGKETFHPYTLLQLYFSPAIYVVMLRQWIHIVDSLKFSRFQVKHLNFRCN